MSENTAIPLVVVFGLITVLLIRSRDVRWWQALVIALFGVYVGQTPFLFTINSFVTWFLSGFTHT
ncbi:hypothetical protein J7W19_16490 [Streptomyces mobaraensis NBRC 13819 = DSM 40847]|uniref:Uncharacterized protein n=1 Tax=Streptomyces mobaraensis (strain ATCC 29032 / DSM 40847 / JCM 4168 / NBRC 13819 / NCIMB 11159 / IPCR 16-22) TaxID=1223523 RepID=M3C493_STRM1|nr:hypothetical protein [Streptomyces mobaraensis]EME98780.1 hypothetical protein H340_19668 [Streptomyces mobaraensis NBRC 13819 = DSM 40847]QTT74778.1 hypothetical protein J7W19_16490 [Streptomyces mobaraensis NBRC 13819 = DSM 40847]